MAVGYNPGDVELLQAMISGAAGSVDITRRILDFSVFENIKKPYTSVVLSFIDNADLLNYNVGMRGDNNLLLSFHQFPDQQPYDGNWSLTSIEKTRSLDNQRTAVYKVVGYSQHMTQFPKVQKSYKGTPGTGVVADLFGRLPATKPLKINAGSRGPLGNEKMPYNINGQQIWKAIYSTLRRSASTKDASSAYVIYENNKSVVVDTLENALNRAMGGGGPTYYQRPMGQDFLRDQALQQYTIISMREETRIDKNATVQNEKQATNTYDLFSKGFSKGQTSGASTYLNIPYNILRPPTFAKDFLANRKRMAGKFDSQSITIHVALNPALTVGESFSVETIAPAGDTDLAVPDLISGPLLATEIRHTVKLDKGKMSGTTTAKGVRGGLPD